MLASSKNKCCLAFTKERRRCRLERTSRTTCDVHKNYFKDWFTKHPPFRNYYCELENSRIMNEYKTILTGPLRPTLAYIQSIPDNNDYISFYMMLVSYTGVNPLLNKPCFKRSIRYAIDEIFGIYSSHMRTQNIKNAHIVLNILCINTELTYEVFRYIIFYTVERMINLQRISTLTEEQLVSLGTSLLTIIFLSDVWRFVFMSHDIKAICKRVSNKLSVLLDPVKVDYFMNTIVATSIETLKQDIITHIKKKCNIYKEDLMMTVYEPSRLQKYLDSGLELEDL